MSILQDGTMELLTAGWPGVISRPAQISRSSKRKRLRQLLREVTDPESSPESPYQSYDAHNAAGSAVRMPAVNLSFEVLVHVMFMASQDGWRASVSALMRTCRTLHHHGGKLLLSMTIHLYDSPSILSFTSFMLSSNNPSLFPHLRERMIIYLVSILGAEMPDYISMGSFIDVLARSTCLRSLHILKLDRFLDSHPGLCTAVSALPALQDLLVRISQDIKRHQHIARFFRALRCPLVVVRLEFFHSNHGKQVEYRREADPIWLFAGVASTLKSIALKGRYQLGTTHAYPQVRRCHVDAMTSPSLRPFVTSFPALRILVSVPRPPLNPLYDMNGFVIHPNNNPAVWDAIDENVPKWESFREANRNDQLVHGSWPSLDTLIANSLIAYTFGLTCHIDRVHLLLQLDRNDRTVLMVANVLRDTQPRSLRLAFYMVDIQIVVYMLEYLVYVRYHLSELELRLNISEDHFEVETFLEQVATSLELSNITSLRVELVCFKGEFLDVRFIQTRDCLERERQGILDYCVTKAALESAEVPQILGHFVALNPRLRRVEIAWSSCHFNYGIERCIGVDLDVGPEVYDRPGWDHPDNWDASW